MHDRIAGRDGSDHLVNVEFLQFADGTVGAGNLLTGLSGLSGDALQVLATDGTGNITSQTVRHADGSRDVYISDIAGKDYASEHDVISAGGRTVLVERFFADGDLAFRQTVNGDNSVDSTSYDAEGHLLNFLKRFADGSFDQFTYDASGSQTGETIRHTDGSRDVYSFGIVGKEYTSQHVISNYSGHSMLIEQFHADGTLALKQTVDAGGVRTLVQYDQSGHIAQQTVTQTDGSYVQSSYAVDGALTGETTRHADGSRDIYSYGIVGKDYSSQHLVNNSAGHSVLIERFRSDGTLALKQTVDANGARRSTSMTRPVTSYRRR